MSVNSMDVNEEHFCVGLIFTLETNGKYDGDDSVILRDSFYLVTQIKMIKQSKYSTACQVARYKITSTFVKNRRNYRLNGLRIFRLGDRWLPRSRLSIHSRLG